MHVLYANKNMIKLFVCRICGEPYLGGGISDCPFCGAPLTYLRPVEEFEEIWDVKISEKETKDLNETLKLEVNATSFYEKVSRAEKRYSKYNRLFKQLARVEKEHVVVACKFLKKDFPELFGEDAKGLGEDLKRTKELEQEAIGKYKVFLKNAKSTKLKHFYTALIHAEEGHDEIVSREI